MWHATWKRPLNPFWMYHVLLDSQLWCYSFCSQPPTVKHLPTVTQGLLTLRTGSFQCSFYRVYVLLLSSASWDLPPCVQRHCLSCVLTSLSSSGQPLLSPQGQGSSGFVPHSALSVCTGTVVELSPLASSVTCVPKLSSPVCTWMSFWVSACSRDLSFSFLKTQPLYLEPFSPQGTCGNAGRHFSWWQLGVGYWHLVGIGQGCHWTSHVHRTVPHNEEVFGSKCP